MSSTPRTSRSQYSTEASTNQSFYSLENTPSAVEDPIANNDNSNITANNTNNYLNISSNTPSNTTSSRRNTLNGNLASKSLLNILGNNNNTKPITSGTFNSTMQPDVFADQENHYRLQVQPFPPYVLDTLNRNNTVNRSDDTDSDSTTNTKISEKQQGDPFVNAFLNEDKTTVHWDKFLNTLKSEVAYPSRAVHYDESNTIMHSYNLDSEWKGEIQLNEYLEKENLYQKSKGGSPEDYQYQKFRSKAGYWIYENKKDLKPKFMDVLMSNMYVPLFFRLFNLILSAISVALSSRIIVLSNRLVDENSVSQQPSSIMAVVVQSFAVVYLLYIAYDEFTSQPLGLRNPKAKIRLILLDLLFIIFSSANLSLSFNTLYDSRWVCTAETVEDTGVSQKSTVFDMCEDQKTLAAFLFVILVFWVLTFSISMFRVVKVVASHGNGRRN